ncbi:MAG: GyrI-like domain-containing protein [archaeon]|nr:MAG: GyrI-like domain-containing protein [archaeon]
MSDQEPKYTQSQRMLVASVQMKGPYSGIGTAMGDLKAWIDTKGIEQTGYPFCLYYDNPTETQPDELRSEACIPVSKAFMGEGKYIMKEFKEALVAETRHQGDPKEFAKTYGPFLEGLLNSGYQIVGPAREYYMTISDVKGPGAGFLIQQPVSKK